MGGGEEEEPHSKQDQHLSQNTPSAFSQEISHSFADKYADASMDRDAALALIELEKKLALIKAWEESEKIKAENKAYKKLSSIDSWENNKKISIESDIIKIEEKLEKKKAEYAEQMKHRIVEVKKQVEEKKANIEAKRREHYLKVEETAAKLRSSGFTPKNLFKCFSG